MGEWPPFGGDDLPRSGDDARFVILPVPYEGTVTYRKGTAAGPRAILAASSQIELFDEELGLDPMRDGVQTCDGVTTDEMPDALAGQLEPRVRALLDAGRIPICLGGEHSISLGPIRAAARAFPGLGVLQLDAHPDLRDEYEGTKFGHGCVMRRALDLTEVARLTSVGLRAVSGEDAEAMGDERVRPFFAHDLHRRPEAEWIDDVVATLPETVYVTIDVDGFDPGIVPGTGTPEPGGLTWWPTMALLKRVCETRRVVAFDVVEVIPEPPSSMSEFAAARCVMKMIAYLSVRDAGAPANEGP
ncbi:MAG: agmatinase [Planctomycetota bacterium]